MCIRDSSNTINALVQRLNRQTDPVWVRADVIGALTAVTGQRFAYDIDQWNQWWESQRQELQLQELQRQEPGRE